jgi:hypothetical protein
MRRPLALTLVLLAVTFAPRALAAEKVTLAKLLPQMTDLAQLSEYPDPPYVAKQFSSYDRASVKPNRETWFANDDRGFMLYDGVVKEDTGYMTTGPQQSRPADGVFKAGTRVGIAPNRRPIADHVWAYATAKDGGAKDGKIPQGYIPRSAITMDPQGHVLAEMDGPGCVVRIWSANPNDAGKVRMYLDGAKKPAIEAPLTALLSGEWQVERDGKKWTPFPEPLAHERSRGYNLYFPIAYAKHCKITIEKPNIYYHVDYRTYPKGTAVETCSLEGLAHEKDQVARVVEWLKGKKARTQEGEPEEMDLLIGPGKQDKSFTLRGPKKIVSLTCRLDAGVTAAQLRGTVLTLTFDGAAKPQVWCPLGDFFASSPGANPYSSLPVVIEKTKERLDLHAYWVMPFQKKAEIGLHNHTKGEMKIFLEVGTAPYQWTDRSMHFHAKWRIQTMKTRPFRDWTYCAVKGKGVFVGDMLSIMNPVAAWWGEGDEKIYVDGETFPSWFGTGTEDYYGYAWSSPEPFQHAYHNQTRSDGKGTGGTFGRSSVNRFHILDAIPFTKSFRFDLEVWHWTPTVEVNYAATSYWYARPGATDDFKPAPAEVLQKVPAPPPPYRIPGAIEGESLKVAGKSGKFDVGPQDMTEFSDGKNRWSGNRHLWVRPNEKGAWTDLELPVAADGKYRVVVYLTKARDYGTVQFRIDGQKLGKAIDCFASRGVLATGPVELGTVELKKGKAKLRVEVAGTNEKSVGLRYMWGLDCVVLKKAE